MRSRERLVASSGGRDKKDINWSFAFVGLFVSRHDDFGGDNDRLPAVSRRQPLMRHLELSVTHKTGADTKLRKRQTYTMGLFQN